jgi:Family of unknown function (DUF6350)
MPTTPDRPDGGPAGSEDQLTAAEAAHLAARETVPVELRPSAPGTGTGRTGRRPADPGARQQRATVRLDPAGRDAAARETVRVPAGRRPAGGPGHGHRETVVLAGARRSRAPLAVAAGFATLWAALLSFLPVAAVVGLARAFEGAGGLGGAALAGLAGWLLGHGVPIGTPLGPLSLAPLLITLLAGWRLNRAGLHVTRAIGARRSGSPRAALLVAATIGLWYAVLGALAATVVNAASTVVSVPGAAGRLFVAGVAGSLVGSLRGTGAARVLARRLPAALRHALRTGVVAALSLLAAGAAATGLAVAVGGGQAAGMIGAYRTGVAGQAGITLVSLAYGGNGAVWAAAYLLGPGFLLGTGTAVRLTDVTVGPLPTVPLLAALPDGPMGATGALLLAVPVVAGMTAGWALTRRLVTAAGGPDHPARPAWGLVLGAAALAGPVAGAALGALAWLSGGALGDGRMSAIGPVPWQVALVGAAVVAVSASLGAAAARAFRPTPR